MAKRKKSIRRKTKYYRYFLEEYNIRSADDIQDALKNLLGGTIQSMIEAELNNHLGYKRKFFILKIKS